MIISDGTTDITITTADANGDYIPIKSKKITAGGEIRSRTTGSRYLVSEIFEVTGDQLLDIQEMIQSNASEYFYTPSTIPPEWSASDFPMSVDIEYTGKTHRIYNGQIKYFISLAIESNEVYFQ